MIHTVQKKKCQEVHSGHTPDSAGLVKKPLSIAMFGQRFPSDPASGGVEKVVSELTRRMAAQGHQITCFNRTFPNLNLGENTTRCKNIFIRKVPTIHRKGLAAFSSTFCAAFLSAFGKFDVVHIHAEGPAAMCWLPKLLGKRVIVTIHGLDWQRKKWNHGFGSKYIHLGERCAARYADEIIVLSEEAQNYFKNVYLRETTFIANGTDSPQIREANLIRTKFDLEKDGYILYLSRIVPEKRADLLIEAFKQLRTNKRLIITGSGSDTDGYIEELHRKAAGDERISFTGIVKGRLLEELYSNAYLYVLPSDLEGMPLGLLEAMSYGNCCLTSDIPECSEVVEDKAVTFQKGNADDLRDKLQMLCDQPEIVRKYKEEAEVFITEKYSWDETVEKTLKVYQG